MQIIKDTVEAVKILASKDFWKTFIAYYSPEAIAERLESFAERKRQIEELEHTLFMRERKLTAEECRLLALHTPWSLDQINMVNSD